MKRGCYGEDLQDGEEGACVRSRRLKGDRENRRHAALGHSRIRKDQARLRWK